MEIVLGLSAFILAASLLFVAGGSAKLAGVAAMRTDAEHFGFHCGIYRLIGAAEFAGGLIVCTARLAQQPLLGVVAATGLTALMFGTMAFHLKVTDSAVKAVPAAVFALTAGIVTCLFAVN